MDRFWTYLARLLAFLPLLTIGFGDAMAQWAWNKGISTSQNISARACATDANGDLYVIGSYTGTISLGSGLLLGGMGQSDIWVAKYSAAGTPLWAIRAGSIQPDEGTDITISANGTIWITGSYTDSMRIGSSSGSFLTLGFGSSDIFIASLDSASGLATEVQGFGGPNQDEGQAITTLNNQVYFLSRFEVTCPLGLFVLLSAGSSDLALAAYTPGNSIQWAYSAGSAAMETAGDICHDGTKLYFSGQFGANLFSYRGSTLPAGTDADAFVAKVDLMGNPLWLSDIRAGTGSSDIALKLAANPTGVFAAGEMDGNRNLVLNSNPDIILPPVADSRNIWYTRIDPATGWATWAKMYGGADKDYIGGITLLPADRLGIAGTYIDNIQLGTLAISGNSDEAYVLTADQATGEPLAAYTSTSTGLAAAYDISSNQACLFYVCGDFEPNISLPGTMALSSGSPENAFIARYNDGSGNLFLSVSPQLDTICAGDSVSFTLSSNIALSSWSYSTDGGLTWMAGPVDTLTKFTFFPTQDILYQVKVVGPCGILADTMQVFVNLPPTGLAITGLPDSVCYYGPPTTFSANLPGTFSFLAPGFSNTGPSTATFDPSIAGLGGPMRAVFTASSGPNCIATDTAAVYVVDSVAIAFTGLQSDYCVSDTSQKLLTGNIAPLGGFFSQCPCFQDQGNGTAYFSPAVAPPDQPVMVAYYYQATCLSIDSAYVTVHSLPVPFLQGFDTTYCFGEAPDTIQGMGGVTGAFAPRAWIDSISAVTIAIVPAAFPPIDTTWTLTFTAKDNFGCTATINLPCTVHLPPAADAGPGDSICPGINTQLGTPAQGGLGYAWTSVPPGFTSALAQPTVAPTTTTTYWLGVVNAFGCWAGDSTQVQVFPGPVTAAGPDTTLCSGSSLQLLGTATGADAYAWLNGGDTISTALQPTVLPLASGAYILQASLTASQCVDSDTMYITLAQPASPADAGPNQSLSAGSTVQLAANQPGVGTGTWATLGNSLPFTNNQDPLTTIANIPPGSYLLTWTISNPPCPDQVDTLSLVVAEIVYPTGFSPNGDGVNDLLAFRGLLNFPGSYLRVFTRWGTTVFESNDYRNDWDGTNKGQPLPEDTYYYLLRIPNLPDVSKFVVLQRQGVE